jgi:hypothetical protein
MTEVFRQMFSGRLNIPVRCTCAGFYRVFSTNIRAPNGAFGQHIFCPGLIKEHSKNNFAVFKFCAGRKSPQGLTNKQNLKTLNGEVIF